jgi:putative peptidoglycan lipid II flippase
MILLSLPASIGLILLRQPLVAMLYQRGAFDERSTALVAWALLWYAAGLAGHCLVEVLARAFYAMHDTRTPVVVGATAMGLNVAFSIAFAALFTQWGWMPHGGLALGNSLATALEALALVWLMRRRLEGLEGRSLLTAGIQATLATVGMSAALAGWLSMSAAWPSWAAALGGAALGGGVYGTLVLLLGVTEARQVIAAVRRRLGR